MEMPVVAPALPGNVELRRRRPPACSSIRATTSTRTPTRSRGCCADGERRAGDRRGRPRERMLARATRSTTMARTSTRRSTSALLRAPRRGRPGAGPGAARSAADRGGDSSCSRASRRRPRAASAVHRPLLPARPLPERLPGVDRGADAGRRRRSSSSTTPRPTPRRSRRWTRSRQPGVRECSGMRAQRRPERRAQPRAARRSSRALRAARSTPTTCCCRTRSSGMVDQLEAAPPDVAFIYPTVQHFGNRSDCVAAARLEPAPAPTDRTSARRRRCSTRRVFACRRRATTRRSSSATRTGT